MTIKHSLLEKTERPLSSSVLFPEIQKELQKDPSLVGRGEQTVISQTKPVLKEKIPVAIIEVEDRDILKFITGGLYGVKAFAKGKIKVAGDLQFATEVEYIFYKTGGVEKTRLFLQNAIRNAKL